MRSLLVALALATAAPALRADLTPVPPGALATAAFRPAGDSWLGVPGFEVHTVQGGLEYVAAAGEDWVAYRWDPQTSQLVTSFVRAPVTGDSTTSLAIGDVLGDGQQEIVVWWRDRGIDVHDAETKELLVHIQYPTLTGVAWGCLGDVDADGKLDLITSRWSLLEAYSGGGALLWSLPLNGRDVVAGQMDGDPGLEIAAAKGSFGSGYVLDVATQTVQWTPFTVSPMRLEAVDTDGDGRLELLEFHDRVMNAWDVASQSLRYTRSFADDTRSSKIVDIGNDGSLEVVIGGHFASKVWIVRVADNQLLQLWQIPTDPGYTADIDAVDVADVDGDGSADLICSANHFGQELLVLDVATHAVRYRSPKMEGPFFGPLSGDVDGDGLPEVVAMARSSKQQYAGPRIFLLDPTTLQLRSISSALFPTGSGVRGYGLSFADVDADGSDEVVALTTSVLGQRVGIYDVNPSGTIYTIWESPLYPYGQWPQCAAVGDVDGDGLLEVVTGENTRVRVLDLASATTEWEFTIPGGANFTHVALADVDWNGRLDIVARYDGTGQLFAFDGITKARIPVMGSPCATFSLGETRVGVGLETILWTGDASGNVSVLRPVNGVVRELARAQLGGGAITSLSQLGRQLGLAFAGRAQIHAGLSPTPQWTSEDYDVRVESNVLLRSGPGPKVVTANRYAILGF